jgi:hypothetical protein
MVNGKVYAMMLFLHIDELYHMMREGELKTKQTLKDII